MQRYSVILKSNPFIEKGERSERKTISIRTFEKNEGETKSIYIYIYINEIKFLVIVHS